MQWITPFVAATAALFAVPPALGQEALPRPDPEFGGTIGRTYEESEPDYPQPVRAPANSPNVLIVLLDDLGTDKVSAYREHPDAPPTPVIDALADQGMLFRNAYASPVCSPSRAALLTGRHGQRYGLGDTVETGDAYQVPLDEVFLPERLGDMGYGSVALGKWHLAHPDSRSYLRHPERAGFDAFAGTMRNFNPDEFDYTRWEKVVDGSRSVVTTYATTDTFDDAIEAVRTLPEPWLAYVAPQAPHSPWHVPPDPLNLAGVTAADDDLTKYDAMVRAADAELGRLLAEVDLATTCVFVLGDNGTPRQATTPPFDPNGAKTKMAEGGIGVPLVVAGPTVAPGTETGALAHVVDVFATVAELAGADVSDLELDGVSLVDTLVDPGLERRAFVYVERFGDAGLSPEVGWTGRRCAMCAGSSCGWWTGWRRCTTWRGGWTTGRTCWRRGR